MIGLLETRIAPASVFNDTAFDVVMVGPGGGESLRLIGEYRVPEGDSMHSRRIFHEALRWPGGFNNPREMNQ